MFELPQLPYSFDALEPYIDAKTMEIHHDLHHGGYVKKLNAALEGHEELQSKTIEELLVDLDSVPEDIRTAVRNNGGGHYNHSLFWQILSKDGSKEPIGRVAEEINKVWGDFNSFKEEFVKQASTLFGSGWVMIGADNEGNFHLHQLPNQDSTLLHDHKSVMGLDVWEHAYYLKYQNRRPEYIDAFWNVINWDMVEELYNK